MRRRDPFLLWIAAAFSLALAVRWLMWWHWYRDLPIGELNDNVFYHVSANLIADGQGFTNPFSFEKGIIEPTAGHPPGFSVYLSIWSFFGLDSVSWHRVASGFISATVVIPIGLVVRKLARQRAAVIAMILAALHPPLFMNDGLILSESMYIPLAALTVWSAYRFHERPDTRRVVELSAVLAVGALTRSEPFMMFFLLLTPLVLIQHALTWKKRITLTATAAVVAMAILAPWVARNLATFEEPTFLAAGPGYVLELANCDLTYSGDFLGYWHQTCDGGLVWPEGDESVVGAAKFDRASAYITSHLDEQPKVVAARVGRLLGLYRPIQSVDLDVMFEQRIRVLSQLGLITHFLVMAAAVAGAAILRRRDQTLIPPGALIFTAVFAAAMSFGITRYRVGADVGFVILAAVAIGAALDRYLPSEETLTS